MKNLNIFHHANGVTTQCDDEETTPFTESQAPDQQDSLSLEATKSKERVWVVVVCCFVASLASLLSGMAAGITSPALQELSSENLTIPNQYFNSSSILPSVFGVSKL